MRLALIGAVLFLVCYLCHGKESDKGLIPVTSNTENSDDEEDGYVSEGNDKEGAKDSERTDQDNKGIKEKFVPTKEWQTVKPGQSIPAGLHVRINMQTGKKEAKLIDDPDTKKEEKEEMDLEIVAKVKEDGTTRESRKFSHGELKHALKNIKADDVVEANEQDIENIREKFRSIEELKKEFMQMNMNMKSNAELMRDLIEEYKQANDRKKWLILDNMEYLVHKFDVAQDFVDMGGLQLLLTDLNSTNSSIRSHSAFTIGSASQGNPKVQIAVLESGALQHLLRLVSLEANHQVQSSALYAISCLVRQFPLAQYKLSQSGGLSVFVNLFKASDLQSMKLQLKVVTLLHDLIMEQHLTATNLDQDDLMQREKMKQYEIFPVLDSFVQHGFCSLVPKLLQSPELDTQEKVLKTMLTVVHACREDFKPSVDVLRRLVKHYAEAAKKENEIPADMAVTNPTLESSEYYFTMLEKLTSELIARITGKSRDEL